MTDPFPAGDDPMSIGRVVIVARAECPTDTLTLLANALMLVADMAEVAPTDVIEWFQSAYAERKRGLN